MKSSCSETQDIPRFYVVGAFTLGSVYMVQSFALQKLNRSGQNVLLEPTAPRSEHGNVIIPSSQ